MIREASESKTSSQPPSPPAEAVTCLAPGFRFHPTDEELISYYLKRKITGRPIRADAISEIDLYRAEPWDLPPRSRLRSRDLEWYFFTSLDRKYSNRCRTNRATAEGYWKTTGKDRPVQRGSRTIGMKKTLVYHAGRAPRGQRTNWVMHEYRLEDEELARAGILQDGYVLCRVFQKNGSGPQNGAQYGAPYIEEEWEREEVDGANFVPVNVDRDELMDPAAQDFVQLGDFIQDPDSGIQHVDDFPSEAEATSDNQAEDSSIYIEDILKDIESSDDLPQEEGYSISHDSTTSFERLGKRNVLEESSNYASMQNKGCVQLKDMFNGDVEGNSINNNGDTDQLEQFQRLPAFEHQMFPQPFGPSDCAPWECSSGQFSEDNLVFYDALSHEIPCSKDGFTFESSLSPLSEVELSEDLMSFYDTTIDCPLYAPPNQFLPQFSPLDSSEWIPSNPSPEVVGSSNSYSKEVFHVPENFPKLSSFGISGPSTGRSDTESEDTKPEDCKDKTLTERLASMLHSIPAPPAFANETGLVGKTAAQTPAASGSAFRLTAGMIQISNWTAMGSAESWTLQKHSELGFFAYGLSDSTISKAVDREQRSKLLSGFYSTFCRGGFHTLFLSAALLALSYKIAVYVCHL